jgi:hypothetical protein
LVRWLKLFFHSHEWKTIDWMPLKMTNEHGRTVANGRRYIQECETCGLVKKRDLV